jgi:short-subunit dehydrogenase
MLEGHVALVTGAGRGIGRAIVVMLAREGCDVALIARNMAELDETKALCEAHGSRALALPLDLATWDAMLDVNLRAVMHATRLALPQVVAGAHAGKRGAVIFISSLGGKFSAPTNAGYAATKHALTGFGGSVFEDVRDH